MSTKMIFAMMVGFGLAFSGCNQDDDDDDNPQANGFTYKGTFYTAESFGIYTYTPSNNYDLRVIFSTGTYNENTNQLEGIPHSIIRLKTVSYVDGNLLGSGDYFHSSSALTPGTIYGGYESFCLNKDSNSSCEDGSTVVGGSLISNKDGNIYTLTYNLTMSNGETLEGYYKGELDYVTQD